MASAEVDPDDLPEISLTPDDRISGKLHLKGVKRIKLGPDLLEGPFRMNYDYGHIHDFEINKEKVTFDVIFEDFPPKERKEKFVAIEIDAKEIFWENIPSLPEKY